MQQLTTREKEIVTLIADGNKCATIARKLYISPKTVMAHRYKIKEKLGFNNPALLTKYALITGLVKLQLDGKYFVLDTDYCPKCGRKREKQITEDIHLK